MEVIQPFVDFGVAGLMGSLWVWERAHSRKRERQLTEAHARLMARDHQLAVLIRLVRQNTKALVSFERLQVRMCEVLEGIAERREG